VTLSRTYRESEAALLDVLVRLRVNQGFFELGYPSLFVYCVSALSLSEAQAGYFSKVARKSEEVPELKAAIEEGTLSLSQARRVVPVITKETAQAWIEKAATLPQRELEREVCAVNPKAVPREKLRPVTADRSEFKVGISSRLEEKMRRAREIVGLNRSWEEVQEELVDLFLWHKDPVQKARRNVGKQSRAKAAGASTGKSETHVPAKPPTRPSSGRSVVANQNGPFAEFVVVPQAGRSSGGSSKLVDSQPFRTIAAPEKRPPRDLGPSSGRLNAAVKHAVHSRDEGRCRALLPDSTRCNQTAWVELHHVKPKAWGGPDTADNLVTLCSAHHNLTHQTGLGNLRINPAPLPR
jgi:hypothetical protein